MVAVVTTIVPVFAIIFLGWIAREKGLIQQELLHSANRLVYYVAVPAMIFREISEVDFKTQFNGTVLACTLFPVLVVFSLAWIVGLAARMQRPSIGTFAQSSFHGNLGYIGLAVAYYFLGTEGFVRTSILAGFLMLLQNFLAVVALRLPSAGAISLPNLWLMAIHVIGNPVILAALAGIVFSLSGIRIPTIIDRTLKILSGLALPLALMVIGASLSFDLMRKHIIGALGSGIFKLIVLPAIGWFLYIWLDLRPNDYLPGLILLAAPTATVTYIMATEMRGDTDLAAAAISFNTLLSAATFVLWLGIAT